MVKAEKNNKYLSKKGIYLLPNLITSLNFFCGFLAILMSFNEEYKYASILIFIGMIFDSLDGKLARMTHSSSDFGVQYDSLSDMISFGLAPAILLYTWLFSELNELGIFISFIFATCAALRLARFNAQVNQIDKKFFQGLPSPAAAISIASFVWLNQNYDFDNHKLLLIIASLVTIITALLMITNLRFYSFKDISDDGRIKFISLIIIIVCLLLIILNPPLVIFTFINLYILSCCYHNVLTKHKKNKQRKKQKQGKTG